MSARIRRDDLRGTESLYGPERDARPSDLRGAAIVCPFCPGNESLTGPPLRDEGPGAWTQRVVANRYPAVTEPEGRHEVIVETRSHTGEWSALGSDAVAALLATYRERERAGYADGYRYAVVFKNAGRDAGATLAHPHAQVVALRDVPLSVRARIARLSENCVACTESGAPGLRTVERLDGVIAYVPAASRFSYEVRIASTEHRPRFSEASEPVVHLTAAAISRIMKRLAAVLGEGFPFNLVVASAPAGPDADRLAHWEIDIIPRTETLAGYELGTGGFLVGRLPEDAARALRDAGTPAHA